MIDEHPSVKANEFMSKLSNKNFKLIHIMEIILPKRSKELQMKDYTDKIKQIVESRENKAGAI